MKDNNRGMSSSSKKLSSFNFFCHQFFHFFLIFLIIFQSNLAFPQEVKSFLNLQTLQTEEAPTQDETHQLNPIEYYDPNVPLTIHHGSFSVAHGQYFTPPIAGRGDIDESTKLGHSVYKLQDLQFVRENIYQLHNELIEEIKEIEIEQGENAEEHLKRIAGTKRTPQFTNSIGTAELAKADGKFLIRIIHRETDTVFYILDESDFSSDNPELFTLQARQHLMGGQSRLDGQKGRDIIYLWMNGSTNTRTVVAPRIEVNTDDPKSPHVLPMYQDPEVFQQLRQQHRRLHRQEYWAAISSKLTKDSLSLALGLGIAQGILAAAVGFAKEFVSGESVDISDIALLSFFFTFSMYIFPSSYRNWINMGRVGFLQRRSTVNRNTGFLEQIREIDWGETFRSKVARSASTSLLYSYLFLFLANDQVANLDISIDNFPIFFELFLWAQLIAIPNFIINNSSKVWWTEQAHVNEIAGITNKDIEWKIPFLPISFKWNHADTDFALFKYNVAQIGKLTHLVEIGLPAALVTSASSIGINLDTLGINFGLITMLFLIVSGRYFLLKKVLNLNQMRYLDDEQTRHYTDLIFQSRLGPLLLEMESSRRRFLIWWHRFRIQNPESTNNSNYLEGDQTYSERSQSYLTTMNGFSTTLRTTLSSLIEINSQLHNLERERHHLENLKQHRQVLSHIQRERDFHENSQQVRDSMQDIQLDFLQFIVEKGEQHELAPALTKQMTISLNNFGKAVHALFETLAFHSQNSLVSDEHYPNIWDRNKTIEQEDILNFLEDHLTERFLHLQQALTFLTVEDATSFETIEGSVALEDMLQEFQAFMRSHFAQLLRHVGQQEQERRFRLGNFITPQQTKRHFNYPIERTGTTSHPSFVQSAHQTLCAGVLNQHNR